MVKRWSILNRIIEAHGYKTYLEIGCFMGHTLERIDCGSKTSVEPYPRCKVTHKMTSDEFFSRNKDSFDLIFVDGLHTYEQTYRDVVNALKCLNRGGTVMMHDCSPTMDSVETRHGTVYWQCWRAFSRLRSERGDLAMHTINTDQGCGIVQFGRQDLLPLPRDLDFGYFDKHRAEMLNLVDLDRFRAGLKGVEEARKAGVAIKPMLDYIKDMNIKNTNTSSPTTSNPGGRPVA